ncbi:helix-turn-helix domain-containing protein [Azospirillum thiophilum]|uniref:helix-turn-helix domain-containing protein n=1 Tax=Azospirillum thiophilum TaxID=528244 RepID=UPI00131432A9|nr:DUF1488 family protein [Azospirillum thiophilum]
MSTSLLTPAQIRAGRALVNWTQEQLAEKAGVSLSTVRDYEKERRGGIVGGLKPLRDALEGAGVVFLDSEGDYGPGVRILARIPNLLRWPKKFGSWNELLINVEWRGKEYAVFVTRDILDDIGRHSEHQTEGAYLRLYEKYRDHILQAAARAIDARGAAPDGRIYLSHDDFPPHLV